MKYILSFLISLAAVIVCVYSFNANAVSVDAATTVCVTIEKMTVAETDFTQPGDYKVTVSLQGNEGFQNIDVTFGFDDTYCEVIAHTYGPYFTRGDIEGLSGAYQLSGRTYIDMTCHVGFEASSMITGDGTLFSIYFRPPNNSVLIPMTSISAIVYDENDNVSSLSVSPYYQMVNIFRIGDATLDGRIAIGDAQFILRTIANANGIPVTAANFMNYIPANFAIGDCVLSFEAMDVDEDGVLTSDDATAIQNYVAGYAATGALLDYCTVYLDLVAYTS